MTVAKKMPYEKCKQVQGCSDPILEIVLHINIVKIMEDWTDLTGGLRGLWLSSEESP